jgi:retinol dehydrogenase 12
MQVAVSSTNPSLSGRTFLVTGANTGIGRATASELARRGGRVFLACRNEEKARGVIDDIASATGNESLEFIQVDLASLRSVNRCARELIDRDEPLHVLINNAGLAGQRGVTEDGFELAFGTNHLGHFALTTALLELLAASAPARVVTVASSGHYSASGIDFDAVCRPTRSLTGMAEYSVSKLCNVLFSQELGRRTAGTRVTTYALHPGVIASDIWRRLPWPVRKLMTMGMKSPAEGACTTVHCATAGELAEETGRYYDDCKERRPSEAATPELARELWERSAVWAGAHVL